MIQPDNEKSWYAFKIFFGKGKPIKAYFVAKGIEHMEMSDIKQVLLTRKSTSPVTEY